MAHNRACTCTECLARQPPAGQMQPSATTPDEMTTVLAEPEPELRVVVAGSISDAPHGTEAAVILGWVVLAMPRGVTGAVVVTCDDGRSRAIWYDVELGGMRAAVMTLVA